ncbi:MAG: FAD binding domain-containing protein [Treponema sp.]|jgi:CO/xanthine dehydrogenase FAD-binding subunit|nr:FAD binding domain-containing protein [Treponema sp.]
MADQLNLVFFPSSYSELFSAWSRYPIAVPYAGGTALIREQGRPILELPSIILSLEKLEEMSRISRSERYLEIGAMAKLSQIIDLGKIVPAALRHCLENIAGPQLRNMATIGGSLCFRGGRLDSAAALTALDAQCELRGAQSSRWISASRFFAEPGLSALKPQELLTRIRIPLDSWDYSAYKKFTGQAGRSKVVIFLAKTQKNVLSDIRIVYKTGTLWRNKDSESILAGKQLPLNHRIAADFIKNWETFASGLHNVDELSRKELINFIEININNLSD